MTEQPVQSAVPESTALAMTPSTANSYPIKEASSAKYRELVDSLRRHSEKRRGWQPDDPVYVFLEDIVADFMARTDLKWNSMMSYRSALLWYMKSLRDPGVINLISDLQAFRPPNPARAQRSHPRSIPETHFKELVDELGGARSKWSRRAQLWVRAGLATGLRPVEWLSARWENESRTVLLVQTAKEKLGPPAFTRPEFQTVPSDRAPEFHEAGEWQVPEQPDSVFLQEPANRRIPVTRETDRFHIDLHISSLHQHIPLELAPLERTRLYQTYYDRCRLTIYLTCKAIWKGERFYSLYTMRSQYAANQKAALGFTATATLMGHSSPDSPATSYYGKGNQAHASYRGLRQGVEAQRETANLGNASIEPTAHTISSA